MEQPIVATSSGPVRGRWRTIPSASMPFPDGDARAAVPPVDRPGRARAAASAPAAVGAPHRSAAFLGIPFAAAPVGPLRFAAPRRPEPWEGVRDALVHGATAKRHEVGPTSVPEPVVPGAATLNVDVYTPAPADRAAHLPVLVWIHGGGYTAGSPASPWYDGAAFNRDGVVTVTISYRLGFDGFGWIPGAPDNRGVLDWIAALEWVGENIEAFGGDPARVTIAGQSAGAGAALTLLGVSGPGGAAEGLFHQVVCLSTALGDVPRELAQEQAERLAALAGVPCTREGFASVSEDWLLGLQDRAARPPSRHPLAGVRALLHEPIAWSPMVDGALIPRPTPDSLASGAGAGTPLVVGATDDEFSQVVSPFERSLRHVPVGLALGALGLRGAERRAYVAANRDRLTTAGHGRFLGRYGSDAALRRGVPWFAEARRAGAARATVAASGPAPTWAYRFAWPSSVSGFASHCLDIPFFFDCLGAPGVAALAGPTPPQDLADRLHAAAVRFVATGDAGWTPWSEAPGATAVFGEPADADAGQRPEASRHDEVPVSTGGYAGVWPLVETSSFSASLPL